MLFTNKKTNGTVDVVFRAFEDSDVYTVIACLEEAYGKTYVHPEFYSATALKRYNKNQTVVFRIAETVTGEPVGIVGSEVSSVFTNQCELMSQVIRHKFRGYGIAYEQLKDLITSLKDREVPSLYAVALACHTFAQDAVEQLGMISCGFVLNLFDKQEFVTEYDIGNSKLSQTIVAMKKQKNSAGKIYLSDEAVPLAKEMYSELGADFEISASGNKSDKSIFKSERDEVNHTITSYIYENGENAAEMVLNTLRDTENDSRWVSNVYLSVSDSGAVKTYERLRKAGFVLAGFQPLTEDKEFVVLHNPLKLNFRMNDVKYINSQEKFAALINRQLSERE